MLLTVMRGLVLVTMMAACSKLTDKPADKPAYRPASENVKIDPELLQFCVKNHFKLVNCADDDQLWNEISNRYFAKLGQKVDDEERKHWIGVYKDDLIVLYRDRAFEKDCATSLAHTRPPSPSSVNLVTAAREKSCAEFATAFGNMVFGEGAFFDPR
jgi:hypothetical protein